MAGQGYDLGVATGDYDNDGDPDLFIAGLRRNTLFRNDGHGTFTDVTEKAGLARPDPTYGTLWAVAAAFTDYDRDGRLDLFVSNYCVWDPAKEPVCGSPEQPDYCHPKQYQGLPNSLFRNNGDGTFTDVSAPSGIRAHVGKGMGIGVADFDGDGWTDLFVSNDTLALVPVPERPQRHLHRVRLRARGRLHRSRGGRVRNGGRRRATWTTTAGPTCSRPRSRTRRSPSSATSGAASSKRSRRRRGWRWPRRARSGWGNAIADLNNDGWKDLFVACRRRHGPERALPRARPHGQRGPVNLKGGRFVDGSDGAGRRLRAQGRAPRRRLRRHRQ